MSKTLRRILHSYLNTSTINIPISTITTFTKTAITNALCRYDVKACIPTISVLLFTGVILVTVVPYVFKVSSEEGQIQCSSIISVNSMPVSMHHFPPLQNKGAKLPSVFEVNWEYFDQ